MRTNVKINKSYASYFFIMYFAMTTSGENLFLIEKKTEIKSLHRPIWKNVKVHNDNIIFIRVKSQYGGGGTAVKCI